MMEVCLTHLEVWAGCICRKEELFQVGGMSVPSRCSQGCAPADFDFSKLSPLVDWPVGRSRVSRAETDAIKDGLV